MINNLKENYKGLKNSIRDDLKYLVKSGKFNFSFMILSIIFTFIITWLIANFTTPEFYGKYLFILATSEFFTIFAFGGINQSLLQSTSKGYDYFLHTSIKKKFKFSLIGSFLILVFSIYIYYFFEIDFDILICLIIVSIFFPIICVLSIIAHFLYGKFKFKELFIYQLINLIITHSLIVIIIFFFRGNLILYFLLMYCFQTVINSFFLKSCISMIENKKFNIIREREALDLGYFLTKYSILVTICLNISKLIIGLFFGPAVLAYYSIGISIIVYLQLIIKNTLSTFLPKFSQSGGKISKTFLIFIIFCSILLYIGVIFFLPLYINLLFPKYKKSILYGNLYAVTLILNPFNELISFYFRGQEQRKIMKYQAIFPQFIMLFLLIPFLLLFGIFGIIYVEIIRQIIIFFILLSNINKFEIKP